MIKLACCTGMVFFVLLSACAEAQSCFLPESFVSEDIRQIQQKLRPDEMVIEYSVCDSVIKIKAITQDIKFISEQDLGLVFWSSFDLFSRSLKMADFQRDPFPAQVLYSFLIAPFENLLNGKNRLIIIPGEWLDRIPFEAILRCNDLSLTCYNNNSHYLVEDFEIVYHPSIELWSSDFFTETHHEMEFIGFSPLISYGQSLSPLPNSSGEIMSIKRLFTGRGLKASIIAYRAGSKDQFLKNVSRGRIIHFATHTIPVDQVHSTGGILLSEGNERYTHAIQDLDLLTPEDLCAIGGQADLLVLNSCRSVDLLRDLQHASGSLRSRLIENGVRNILYTLWNITDHHSRDFMVKFYRAWLDGKTFSEALRAVKLDMIRHSETALPVVWAPYVLTGR